jgi:hypothetical protein
MQHPVHYELRVAEDEHGQTTVAGPIDACCEALFASALQPSDNPTVTMAAAAISSAVRRFGRRGCLSQMAQEFGDHPDEAAQRMRWARQLAA